MLILTRSEGIGLVLETSDGPITVVCWPERSKKDGKLTGRTKVGISAPKVVTVLREELVESRAEAAS